MPRLGNHTGNTLSAIEREGEKESLKGNVLKRQSFLIFLDKLAVSCIAVFANFWFQKIWAENSEKSFRRWRTLVKALRRRGMAHDGPSACFHPWMVLLLLEWVQTKKNREKPKRKKRSMAIFQCLLTGFHPIVWTRVVAAMRWKVS